MSVSSKDGRFLRFVLGPCSQASVSRMSSTYGWCWMVLELFRRKNRAAPWEWLGKGQPRETQTKSRAPDSQAQQRKYRTPFQSLVMKSTFAAFPAALLLGCWFWQTTKPFSIRGFSCPCPWRACWVMPVQVIKVVLHLLNRWGEMTPSFVGWKMGFCLENDRVYIYKNSLTVYIYIFIWLKSKDFGMVGWFRLLNAVGCRSWHGTVYPKIWNIFYLLPSTWSDYLVVLPEGNVSPL